MCLRELVEDVVGLDDPLAALALGVYVLRTWVQGETATVEGVAGTVGGFQRCYGAVTQATVRQWLDELGTAADYPIPQRILRLVATDTD